jgi:phosphonate transport system substrate-binding protein
VVRSDDPATGVDDLAGADYGFINTSCTSSYFSPAILLTGLGKTWNSFLHFVPVPAWQGQIDAVVSKKVRATMVLEDVWRATPENAESTKVIGRYDNCKPPVVIAHKDLDNDTRGTLLDALVAWEPDWDGIFGGLKPYYYADVHPFFHDLDQLPAGI